MKNPYIVGKKIYLRAPEESDIDKEWYQWFSDQNITEFLHHHLPNSIHKQKAFFDSINSSENKIVLCICDLKNDKHIGICGLDNINWVSRSGNLSLVIGNKKYQKGLFAVEAFTLLIKCAFMKLNLNNLRSGYFENNTSSASLHKLFKFDTVGKYKKINYVNGKYYDEILCQLSKEKWKKINYR